ncbi:MAG TPA: PA14 domain-containing protein, partial [Tepidisphaeraceae bacterium]|nr:PA14 domain-containing protein [Tepidisphaeraceae bacterium]
MPRRYRRAPLLPALRPVIQDLEGRTLLAAGLNASYYNDINLSGTPVTRVDNGVNFAFSSTVAPAAGINPQLFSARWTGQVTPKYTQAYTFTTRSDDGVRLWVNGQQLVNNWNRHAPTNNSGVINLVAGQSYDVRMEYFNQWGNGVAQLSWASASQASQIIPSTSLSTDGTTTPPPVTPPPPPGNGDGLFGAYYGDMTFGVKKFQRIDPTVNFNWGAGSPNAAIPTDNFSVRWTGQILAQKSETYTFYTTSDDGARLTINGVRVIDKLIPQGPTEWSGSIALVAGQKYNIALEYFDRSGGASAVLRYSSPTTAKQVVPQAVLFSSQSTTPPPVQAPAAPTGVSAAAINTTQIQLSWTDLPTENGYKIERSANGTTGWTQIATPSAGSTGYLNTGLAPNTTYYYRLRGFNAGGDGAYSAVFSAKTQAITPPAAPTFTGIRPVPVTALEIKWTNVAGETGYKLERSLSPTSGFTQIATTGADLTTYVDDSNLPGNTLFYYRVRAYNGGGDSDYSPASGGTTNSGNPGPPATLPTNFAAQALSTTEIKLTWSDSTYESVYEIERSPNGTTGWTQIGGADANILTYTDTFLTPNTTYFYRIRAGNSGGFTPYTAVVSAKTLSAPAGASQPDVQVQVRKETTFAGDNVYNTTGVNQVRAATGEFFPTIFHVRVYNDGATADSFVVTAPTGDADYRLAYYDSTTTGWNGG